MGACCNGKESKSDRNEEIYTKMSRKKLLTEFSKSSVPKIEMEVEKSNLNQLLTGLILKYTNSFDMISIKKFSLEQLWNVSKFYLDDFTNSEYILLDLRDKSKRNENFLKKFKSINYTIDEMKMLKDNHILKFKRYLDFKNVIVILNSDLINLVEEILKFFINNKINPKILLLDNNLEPTELNLNNKCFLEILDNKNFKLFPFINLSLKFFPHLNSDNFVFFDFIQNDKMIHFNSKFLADSKNKETTIVNFFNNFNTSIILKINCKNEESNSIEGFKLINYDKNYSRDCKTINIQDINTIKDIENIKNDLINYLEIIKFEVISKNAIFIQFDECIDKEVLIIFIFLFVWKITDIPPKKIKNYISENFIFIYDIKNYIQNNFNKVEEYLIKNFDLNEEQSIQLKRVNTELDDLKLAKDKVKFNKIFYF